MSRLTNDLRDKIAHAAEVAAFDKRWNDLEKQEQKLAERAYNSVFPPTVRKLAKELPEGWLITDNCLRFNVNGCDIRLNAAGGFPVPAGGRYGCQRLGSITGELAETILSHAGEKEKLKEERTAFFRSIQSKLYSLTTFKQLAESWPEGKKFYQPFIRSNTGGSLVVRFDDINQTLGIKEAA